MKVEVVSGVSPRLVMGNDGGVVTPPLRDFMQPVGVIGAVFIVKSVENWDVLVRFAIFGGDDLATISIAHGVRSREDAELEAEAWRMHRRLGNMPVVVVE